jgi:predicted Zn finger-like uncharacterized protein
MVITVQCPSCATSFPVDPRKIPEKGVKVRCSSCSAIFRVERPVEAAPPPPPPPAEVATAPIEPPPSGVQEAPAAEAAPPAPVVEEAPPAETAPPPPVAAEAPRVETAPPPPVSEAPAPIEPPPPPTPEPLVEPEPHFRAPEVEEPREEAVEEPAEPWRADVPATTAEPPSEAEIESWLTPRPEFEIRPAPEAESTTEPEVEVTRDTEEAAFEVQEPLAEPPLPESYVGAADDWVVERDPDIDTSGLDIEPLETIETSSDQVREEVTFSETPFDFEPTSAPMEIAEPTAEAPTEGTVAEPYVEPAPFREPTAPPQAETPALPERAPPPSVPEPGAEVRREPEPKLASPPPGVGAFTLGKRDPKDKARRLARVLVSDMIMYNPERHERALANGTLKEDFEDEIRKSWKEYVEQVGEQMARENDYWTEALNDVLAKGQRVF